MYRRLLTALAVWLGLTAALLLPGLAAAQETSLGALVAETQALNTRLRGEVAGLGNNPPSAATVQGFQRRRDLLVQIAPRDPKAAVDLSLSATEVAAAPAAVRPFLERWTYRVG